MNIEKLLQAYADKYALDDFRLEDGLALLEMEDGIEVYVEVREGSLLLHVKVGTEPRPDPRLMRHMLGANLFYTGKNHAALAMDSNNGDILLLLGVDSGNLDVDAFEIAMAELLAEAEYWKDFLGRGKDALDALDADSARAPADLAGMAPLPGMFA
jgi:hypothetical protein